MITIDFTTDADDSPMRVYDHTGEHMFTLKFRGMGTADRIAYKLDLVEGLSALRDARVDELYSSERAMVKAWEAAA